MARRGSQEGCAFKRGKKNNRVWVGRWRETVILPDGTSKRVLRSDVLGNLKDIDNDAANRNVTVGTIVKELLRERIRRSGEVTVGSQCPATFSTFVDQRYKPEVLPNLKYATRESYKGLLEKHLVPQFGEKLLCDLTRSELQAFLNRKLESGLSWETVNHLRWLMSAVLEVAVADKAIAENPIPGQRGVKMPTERFLKRPHSALSADDLTRLLGKLEGTARTIVMLAASLGLRIGEILALRWGRIDFERETLRVEETCYKGHFGAPKSKTSNREIPAPSVVIEELISHRSRLRNSSVADLVFATSKGTPLSADNLRKRDLADACAAAKIRRIDWHTLRHTHATLLHAIGVPLKIAQAQLGHARMSTTCEVYTHAVGDDQRAAIDDLARYLFPNDLKSEVNNAERRMGSTLIQ